MVVYFICFIKLSITKVAKVKNFEYAKKEGNKYFGLFSAESNVVMFFKEKKLNNKIYRLSQSS